MRVYRAYCAWWSSCRLSECKPCKLTRGVATVATAHGGRREREMARSGDGQLWQDCPRWRRWWWVAGEGGGRVGLKWMRGLCEARAFRMFTQGKIIMLSVVGQRYVIRMLLSHRENWVMIYNFRKKREKESNGNSRRARELGSIIATYELG